jgi:hypothetical protein
MTQNRLFRALSGSAAALTLLSAGQAAVTSTTGSGKEPSGKSPKEMAAPKEESAWDKIWGLFSLYKNDANPFIEELAITGRFQGQYYAVDGDNASDDDWDWRRFRLGLKTTMLNKHLLFNGEMYSEFNPGGDFYSGLKNFNLTYKASEAFALTVGKLEPHFGYDYSISDTKHIYFERNSMINQFKNEYSAGFSIDGKIDKWSYYVSAVSNSQDKEFGDLDGGWSATATIGYDLKEALGADVANLRLEYLHSEHDKIDNRSTTFDDGIAASLEYKQGPFGLISEIIAGFGDAANNASLILTPSYDITKKLQVVGRYQLGVSDEDKGFAAQSRYEKKVGAPNGDLYNAGYLGLNYYLYGHKAKIMTGVEYANMSGGDSTWTFITGYRLTW